MVLGQFGERSQLGMARSRAQTMLFTFPVRKSFPWLTVILPFLSRSSYRCLVVAAAISLQVEGSGLPLGWEDIPASLWDVQVSMCHTWTHIFSLGYWLLEFLSMDHLLPVVIPLCLRVSSVSGPQDRQETFLSPRLLDHKGRINHMSSKPCVS